MTFNEAILKLNKIFNPVAFGELHQAIIGELAKRDTQIAELKKELENAR